LIGGLLLLGTGHGYRFNRLAKKLRDNEMSLREKEAELESIIYRTPFMLIRIDRDLRYRFISQAYLELTGRRPEQVIGKRLNEILGEKDFNTIRPYIDRVLKGERVEFEREAQYPGLGARFVRVVYTPERDERGGVIGWIASMLDITERKREEQTRQHLATIVETSRDAIWSWSIDGTITAWNREAERMLGYTAEEIIGKSLLILFPPERVEAADQVVSNLAKGLGYNAVETVRLRKDGRPIQVELSISPIRDSEGRVVAAATVCRDISERKRAEETERMLLREVDHRSNNLLAVIQSIAQRSLSGDSLPEAKQAFESRLQALARINQRLTTSDWVGLSLKELVRQELDAFAARTEIEGVDISLSPQNAQNFSLALHELATNAVKYGALSNATGRIGIFWTVADHNRVLKFKWQEKGAPPVLPPQRHGFGTLLLRATFADVRFDYGPDGLSCEFDAPLETQH
jgi:PAS domain S-box-containing protein